MRDPLFVPDTKPVNALLSELRSHGVHLAVVVDEFGGTDGVVTMEDLLEEIVGEIRDEYDEASEAEPEFEATPEGDVLIDGSASIGEVNARFGLALPEEDFDTVGGYVFGALGRLPAVGDAVRVEGEEGEFELRVEETEERRASVIRLARPVEVPARVQVHALAAEPAEATA
jgi:putative hemolysin